MLLNNHSSISLEGWFTLFTDASGNPVSMHDQEDAHEYLTRFVDTIDKCMIFTSQPFLIRDLFEGEMSDQLICPNCGVIRDKKTTYSNLSVEVDKGSLIEAMHGLNAVEVIEDFKCEVCNQRVNIQKSTRILTFPKYLIIQAKFFTFDYVSFRKVKINQPFCNPMVMNVRELQESEGESCSEYHLKGIVYHIGVADSGHYYSVIRDENTKWFEMNDEVVTERDQDSVRENCEVQGCENLSVGMG